MDTIPSPFDRFIEVNRGERFHACWHSVPVRVDQHGRVDPVPDVKDGLLVLTNKGMVQCVKQYHQVTDATWGGGRVNRARYMSGVAPLFKIPFWGLVALDAVRLPPHHFQLLVIRFHQPTTAPGPPFLPGASRQLVDAKLLLGRLTDLEEVYSKIHAAGRAAGCPAFVHPGSAPSPAPVGGRGLLAPLPESDESPIRFNAQDEP